MKRKIDKMIPPGTDVKQEILSCLLLLFMELGISFGYLVVFFANRNALYYTKGGKRYLLADAVMPALDELMEGKMAGFLILFCGCMGWVIAHYASFYRESKSIYLMKRLESASELHKRCLAVPGFCLLCGLILMGLLLLVYSLMYYNLTPAQCLPEPGPFELWRCIL